MTGGDWRGRAACARVEQVVLELAHGKESEQRLFVRKVCRGERCPVRAECLADAMEYEAGLAADKRFGVLGGFLGSERAKIARDLAVECVDCPEVIVPRSSAQVRCESCQRRWSHRSGSVPQLAPKPLTTSPARVDGRLPCGTRAGHSRHLRRDEKPCWPCRLARHEYDKALRARRGAA